MKNLFHFKKITLLTLISVQLIICSTNQVFAATTPDSLGISLTNRLCQDLQTKNTKDLADYISPVFIAQRSSGQNADRAEFLKNLPTINDCTLKNLTSKQVGNVLIVRLDTVSNGANYDSQTANSLSPRLISFARFETNGKLLLFLILTTE